jgi:CDP-diacylglycerol--glycerol-3-phosphate 3-phosphatidyltransferase
LQPIARGLSRVGFTADGLTTLGLIASVLAAVAIGTGYHWWAVLAIVAAGVPDIIDGTLARMTGGNSSRGAFFDSVSDRISDLLLLGGTAYWYTEHGDPSFAVLAYAVGALSVVISYERAKAEALGFDARGGLIERAERLILLAVGLGLGQLTTVLWVMLVLSAVTVGMRFVKVWKQASRANGIEPRRMRSRHVSDVLAPREGPRRRRAELARRRARR